MIREYLKNRSSLMCALILLDSRHKPHKIDLEFMEWMGNNGIPFVMVFTKLDKLSSSEKAENLRQYQKEMLKTWESLPQIFHTSSHIQGKDELIEFVDKTNEYWEGYEDD